MKFVSAGSLRIEIALSYFSLEPWMDCTGPRQVCPLPSADSSMCLDQSTGSSRSLIVWPVGAVSNTTTSYSFVPIKSMKRSKDAISVVQAPLRFSSMDAITSSGMTSRYGPMMLSLYSRVASSGSISIANNWTGAFCTGTACRAPTPFIGVTLCPISCSKTSARFDAGSVVTISVFLPARA
ncbi:hypothetical protein BMS3Bbin09_00562 [bacterium BMS3Bbin09]|nr:hypothetical protein BMS3Bbin09_00562 [bacterium BMS3Bbin09]